MHILNNREAFWYTATLCSCEASHAHLQHAIMWHAAMICTWLLACATNWHILSCMHILWASTHHDQLTSCVMNMSSLGTTKSFPTHRIIALAWIAAGLHSRGNEGSWRINRDAVQLRFGIRHDWAASRNVAIECIVASKNIYPLYLHEGCDYT
jgi:hypothetical protein